MRALFFCLALVIGFLPTVGFAQDVPLEKVDRDTYTFSTADMVLIKDFMIDGPTYHITDDPYSFKLVALTEDHTTDNSVTGVFPFVINGQRANVQFKNGQAMVEMDLGKADELKVQLADTNVSESIEIMRRPGWPTLIGVVLFLFLTWFFRHALARGWRKLTGRDKTTR